MAGNLALPHSGTSSCLREIIGQGGVRTVGGLVAMLGPATIGLACGTRGEGLGCQK